MKILMVSPVPTYPVTAGNRARVLSMFQLLTRAGHEVHLLCVDGALAAEARVLHGGRCHVPGFDWQPRRRRSLRARLLRGAARMLRLLDRHEDFVDDWYDERLDGVLRSLQQVEKFDVVIAEYVFLSRALEVFDAGAVKVCDTHGVFADRHEMFRRNGMKPVWFSTTARSEQRALRRADLIVAISQGDAANFQRRLPERPVVLVGHVMPAATPPAHVGGNDLLYVGGDNAANRDGLSFFVDHVLPRVRAGCVDARLLVAGAVSKHASSSSGVEPLGMVADLSANYARAALAINPVRIGAGLSIKTMEALALGVPIVASTVGARGLERFAGNGITIVPHEQPQRMADEIVRLLDDDSARWEQGEAGRRAACTWNEAQAQALLDALDRASAERRRGRSAPFVAWTRR